MKVLGFVRAGVDGRILRRGQPALLIGTVYFSGRVHEE
jgi:hypothetical protein